MRHFLLLLGLCLASCSDRPDYRAIAEGFEAARHVYESEVAAQSSFTGPGQCGERKPQATDPVGQLGVLKVVHCEDLKTQNGVKKTFTEFHLKYSGISVSGCVTRLLHVELVGWAPSSKKTAGGSTEVVTVDGSWFIEHDCT